MAIPAAQLPTPDPFTPWPGGLLDAAIGPADMDPHVATSGAQWLNEVCGTAHLYPAACQAPPYPARTIDAGGSMVTVYPFVVYASYICPPVGTDDATAARRARLRMELSEGELVERAFWGGNAAEGVTGILEQMVTATTATELAASTSIREGISLLEQQAAVAHYRGPLFLHARPRMAAYMSAKGVIRGPLASDQGRWATHYGSMVVWGGGYQGNKPDGTAPSATAENLYITGRVFIWRDPEIAVSPPEQMLGTGNATAGTNQRVMFASRAYAIGVECLAATTLVTRDG